MAKHRRPSNAHKPRTGASKDSSKGNICPYCGKRSYMSRKYAKEAARIQYPTEHLSAYRCVKAPEFVDTSKLWHLGHLADRVVQGRVDRSQVHGSPKLEQARVPKRKPIPAALRATVETRIDKDNDCTNPEGGPMPTIGETAQLTLTGFDRHKGRYRTVSATSPLKDRVALVHGALRAYALTHSFESYKFEGKPGFTGRVSLSHLVRELFQDEMSDPEKQDGLAQAIAQSGSKAGLIRCLDTAHTQRGQLPIWWVAADYEDVMGFAPLSDKPAPAPPPAVKKTPPPAQPTTPEAVPAVAKKGGRAKGSRNRSRLEVMSLAERTLKNLGRPVILDELVEQADFPVSKGAVRDSVGELAKERRVIRRTINDEDRKILKRAGGPRGLGPMTHVLAHVSIAPVVDGERVVGPVTWGLGKPQKPPVAPVETPKPEAAVQAPPTPKEAPVAVQPATMAAPGSPEALRDMVAGFDSKLAELDAQRVKLVKARDGLLAVLDVMEGS